jgi:predicted dehydrogenase
MKKIALIGHGYWGKNLERVIKKNKALFNLVAIVDLKYKFNKNDDGEFLFNNIEELIKSDLFIDCAVISTPAVDHYQTTKKLLKNKIDCLVEKPLVIKSFEAKELYEISKKYNSKLMVDNTFLYDNSILELIKIVKNEKFGRILHINFERTNLGPVRKDVSALWDLTAHDLSILLAINNVLPKKISVNGGKFIDKNIYDVVTTSFFQNDVFVSSFSSWLHPEKTRTIKIVGENNMVVWDGMDLNEELKIYSIRKKAPKNISDDLYSNMTNTKNSGFRVPYIERSEPLDSVFKDFYKRITNKTHNSINNEKLITSQIQMLEMIDKKLSKK